MPDWVSKAFQRLIRRLDLPIIRYHDLRHSAASILVAVGCNVKEVSTFLGHNQISTTLDIYAHLFNSSSVELMRKYDTVLSGANA
ncbi:MAG: tyrosine-type recombinase/integrase [Defluviitaleaceae bacterium]|nr:tyrosine-type recombinase/integrase [Defluviitaleaceae bacterium]MCL2275900.1 tyrosine-type recombinase/integrase [Defluviitaleaceae bacterium]